MSKFLVPKIHSTQKLQAKRAVQNSEDSPDITGLPPPNRVFVPHKPRLVYTVNTSPTILICGHKSRDTRCGILGPLLRTEFNRYIGGRTRHPANYECSTGFELNVVEAVSPTWKSGVALTSHTGGHAFAGNVLMYLPKKFRLASGMVSPLAGMGIWYGRVEPRHVWGIMEETVQRGYIINELLRGIHEPGSIDRFPAA